MKIKIVCLNVWLGGVLFDEILEFLRAEQPDILLLQEAYNSEDQSLEPRFRTVQEIQKQLQYTDFDFARTFLQKLPFGTVERGNAVLSKFPIQTRQTYWLHGEDGEYEDIPENFTKWLYSLQHVSIDVGTGPLDVFNFQGIWDLDGERDSPDRLRMSKIIAAAIRDKPRVILAGDTNAQPTTQTIRNIEAGLTNVYKDELSTTFNLRRKDLEKYPGYATAAVDMAFVSPDIKIIEHRAPDVDISDHLPLVFTIQV